jgi:4a-hydroxytetrahydrobiopterin dehydratase
MQREILGGDELAEALRSVNGWSADGKQLKKRKDFPDFAAALQFVNSVGELAETADHHPDITFGWGYVELCLITHDRGGITDVDIALAKQIDGISN